MNNLKKHLIGCVALMLLILFFQVHQSMADVICRNSTQESKTFSGPNVDFQYDIDVDAFNLPSIGAIDFLIYLSNDVSTVFSPTFEVAVDQDPSDAVALDDLFEPIALDGYVHFGEAPGPFDPDRRDRFFLEQLPGDNSYRMNVTFSSLWDWPMCGPLAESELPTIRHRTIKVRISNLTASGHLQVNGISKSCSGGVAVIEHINPAVSFTEVADTDPCPDKRPIDVIMVLDISGSMNSGTPTTKIEILHGSVQDFINLWATGDTGLSIPAFFVPDDQVGAVFFQSTAKGHPDPPGVDVQLVQFGSNPESDLGDITTELHSLYDAVGTKWSNGATAMGDGLQKALDAFDDTTENHRYIILFTNGMQNVGNLVDYSTDPYVLNSKELRSYGIPIYTIGTGLTSSNAYAPLLEGIATQTGAKSWFTAEPGLDLHEEFITIFQDILRGYSPSIVGINSGIIDNKEDGDGEITHTYQVNKAAKSGVFYVSWHPFDSQDRNENAITMEVVGPGSIGTLNTQGYIRNGDHFHIHSVGFPLSGHTHEGSWTIKVIEHLQGSGAYYHAGLIVEEAELDCRVGAAPGDYGTGEAILLRASLSVEGQPVTGSAVQCKVTHPRTALGTFLTNSYGLSDDDLKNNPPGVDPDNFPNAYSRKLYRLIEEKKLGKFLEPITDLLPIELYDDGNKRLHGDIKAGDGVYSALYKKTRLPGQYKFDFLIKGNHTVIGEFERNEVSSTIVKVKTPDPDKSEIYQDKLPGDKRLITIIPEDRFGNFLGPGFEKNITVESSVGTVATIKDEKVNGTYTTIVSGVPPDADPIFTIKLSGKAFFTGPIIPPPENWIIGGYFGTNFPHNSLNIEFDPGSSFSGLIEYLFASRWAVLVSGGHNTFNSAVPGISDLKVFNISANVKFYPLIGTFQFSIFGGGGFYMFDPVGDKFGINAGSAAEIRLNKWLSFEAKYNYHRVFTSGDTTIFSTAQGGIRFRL